MAGLKWTQTIVELNKTTQQAGQTFNQTAGLKQPKCWVCPFSTQLGLFLTQYFLECSHEN